MTTDLGHWHYKEQFNPDDYMGFIYKITHILDHRFYIGRKQFVSNTTKPPLKSSTSKRKRKLPSDSGWKDYTSSSNELNEMISMMGKSMFRFEILTLCTSKSELAYWEAHHIITSESMLGHLGLNKNIGKVPCRPTPAKPKKTTKVKSK